MELALALEDFHAVEDNGRRALQLALTINDRLASLWVLICFSLLEVRRERPDRAARIWGIVAADIAQRPPPQASSLEQLSAPLLAIDDPAFLAAADAAATEDMAAAIELVLEDHQTEP